MWCSVSCGGILCVMNGASVLCFLEKLAPTPGDKKGESRVFEVVPFHIHAAGRSARSFPRKRQSKWAGVLRRTFNRNPPSGNTGRRCPCGASVWCVSYSRGQRRLFFFFGLGMFFLCVYPWFGAAVHACAFVVYLRRQTTETER